MARAWVRSIPDSYVDATRGVMSDATAPIDVALARTQHAAYCDGLRWLGYRVLEIPPDPALPDGCFVEDPAVVVGDVALIARSAHPVRAREAPSVRAALRDAGLRLVEMEAPATLDGGDVMLAGDRLYVSLSARTNATAVPALAAAFPGVPVSVVPLPAGVLHLKCAVSPAAWDVVVLAEGSIPADRFADLVVVPIPAGEGYAANVVGRDGKVLIADGFPATTRALRAAGLEVRLLDTSEIRKGDGSLTCLSLRTEVDDPLP